METNCTLLSEYFGVWVEFNISQQVFRYWNLEVNFFGFLLLKNFNKTLLLPWEQRHDKSVLQAPGKNKNRTPGWTGLRPEYKPQKKYNVNIHLFEICI